MKLESRCQRRSNAELREIAALAKPSQAQTDWFRQRLDSGEKSGPELYGEMSEKNWLRRFITNEPTYLWQFPETYRNTPTVRFNDDWYMRTSRNMYIEEMTVFAQLLCMNNSCKSNIGQQVSLPYTDGNKVRSCRHFSYTRDNKPNKRRLQGVPARYHELIQDSGYKDHAACPPFIKPLFRDEIINGRASSIAMILTAMQLGGYTRENICHPNSWATQLFCKHHRVLAGLETRLNHAYFLEMAFPRCFVTWSVMQCRILTLDAICIVPIQPEDLLPIVLKMWCHNAMKVFNLVLKQILTILLTRLIQCRSSLQAVRN